MVFAPNRLVLVLKPKPVVAVVAGAPNAEVAVPGGLLKMLLAVVPAPNTLDVPLPKPIKVFIFIPIRLDKITVQGGSPG